MQNSSTSWRRQLQREVELLTKIIHPNCVRLLMTSEHPQTKAIVFVFEWCDGGDLEGWINRNRGSSRISETNTQIFISQLSQALHFLKSLDILHRDLKPSNLLLLRRDPTNMSEDASNYILKVADFGLSRQLSSPFEMAATLCGTRQYMAPEVAKSEKYTFKSDLYSVGIIMFRLLAGTLPTKLFPSPKEVHDALPAGLSPLCVDLVVKLLHPDQDKRIEWEEFILHQWLLPESIISPPAPAPAPTGTFSRSNSAQKLNSVVDPLMRVAEWADSGADTASALVLWTAAGKMAIAEGRLEIAGVCMERAIDAKSLQVALSSPASKISTLWTALYGVCIRYVKETANDEMINVQRRDTHGLSTSLERYDTLVRLLKFGSAEAPTEMKQHYSACLSAVTKKADSLRARLGR
jgi:serine/threonine protein kinase